MAASNARSVLIILVDWQAGGQTPAAPQDSVTTASATNQIQNTDTQWYKDESYGQFAGWQAIAIGWFQIATPPLDTGATCWNVFKSNVEAGGYQAAMQAGYNPANYNVVLYYFPWVGNCGWSGWELTKYYGSSLVAVVWINGSMNTAATAHELGHSLGLGHAHSEYCTAANGAQVALSATCAGSDYGDWYDVMGCCYPGSFTAIQKYALGWLSSPRMADVPAAGGIYTLNPLESSAVALQALRLIDGSHTLWLEYRQPMLEDSFLSGSSTAGVLVHEEFPDGWGVHGSNLLDMTPGSAGGFLDAPLPVGRTWVDTSGTLEITVNWANSTGAQVTIVPAARVPYVVGLRRAAAGNAIAAAGLTPYPISFLDRNCWNVPGTVVSQSPASGTPLSLGSEVKIWIDVWPRVCP